MKNIYTSKRVHVIALKDKSTGDYFEITILSTSYDRAEAEALKNFPNCESVLPFFMNDEMEVAI